MTEEKERVGDRGLKVTDKRMFTADGELREEFQHLDAEAEAAPAAGGDKAPEPAASPARPGESAAPSPAPAESPRGPGPEAPPPAGGSAQDGPMLEIPGTPDGLGAPSFLDLVTLLAEPIALYLGDAELPEGESAENLDLARVHIDLLDILRRKTAGNLDVGEARLLEDLLYRCRLRYVQKRG